jgi:hypothetical protein
MGHQNTTINSNPKTGPTNIETSKNPMTSTEQQVTQLPASVLTADSAPSLPIKVRLMMSEAPILNKPVELTATYSIQEPGSPDLPETIFVIRLEDRFEFISGQLKQIEDLNVGQTIQLKAIVKSIKVGESQIDAVASCPKYPGHGGAVSLYTLVSESGAIVSDKVIPSYNGGGGEVPKPTGQPSTK